MALDLARSSLWWHADAMVGGAEIEHCQSPCGAVQEQGNGGVGEDCSTIIVAFKLSVRYAGLARGGG